MTRWAGPRPKLIRITSGTATGLVIGLIPKAGFTSISKSIVKSGFGRRVCTPDVHELPIRLYIRQPLKRLISAFRCLMRENRLPDGGDTFEGFIDVVLDEPTDSHWSPQLARFDEFNVTEVYQFERIEETWPSDIPLKHLNGSMDSDQVPTLGYRLDELEAYYADDLQVWNNYADNRRSG